MKVAITKAELALQNELNDLLDAIENQLRDEQYGSSTICFRTRNGGGFEIATERVHGIPGQDPMDVIHQKIAICAQKHMMALKEKAIAIIREAMPLEMET